MFAWYFCSWRCFYLQSVGHRQTDQTGAELVPPDRSEQSSKQHDAVSDKLDSNPQPPVRTQTQHCHDSHDWTENSTVHNGRRWEICRNACIRTRARPDLPVGDDTRVVTLLVLIHFHIAQENKGSVSPVGADHTSARDGLRKMRIYRRPTDRLQSLKLSRRGDIKSLRRKQTFCC